MLKAPWNVPHPQPATFQVCPPPPPLGVTWLLQSAGPPQKLSAPAAGPVLWNKQKYQQSGDCLEDWPALANQGGVNQPAGFFQGYHTLPPPPQGPPPSLRVARMAPWQIQRQNIACVFHCNSLWSWLHSCNWWPQAQVHRLLSFAFFFRRDTGLHMQPQPLTVSFG